VKPKAFPLILFAVLTALRAPAMAAVGPGVAEPMVRSLARGGSDLWLARARQEEGAGTLEAPLGSLQQALRWADGAGDRTSVSCFGCKRTS
jgi:hypothetical protein